MRFEMKESYLPTLLQMRLLVGFLGERAQCALNRPDNRGGYLVKVKYPSMSYYPGFVGSFLQPELEEYTR